jgi:hypothetical protein
VAGVWLVMVFHLCGAALWGGDVAAVIEKAYRDCFRTATVGGRKILLRMPFVEEKPRPETSSAGLTVVGGGKGAPAALWRAAERAWASADFARYAAALQARGPIEAADVSDYLASVARIGLDCSGFVWHVLLTVARAGGADLDRGFSLELSSAPSTVRFHINAAFFDPQSGHAEEVLDEIRNLSPGDLILFRGTHGTIVHSAVIQSVDLATGRIRYLQCTDLAPREQRGVHASLISFDPAHPETSLADRAVSWHQRIAAPFADAEAPRFSDDGERYRAASPAGHGIVVRLRALAPALDRIRASGGGPGRSGIRRL